MGRCLAAIAFAVGTSPRSIYNQWTILVTWLVSSKITFSVWYYLENLFCMDYTVVKVTKFVCLSLVTRVLFLENNPGYRQRIVTSVFNFSLQNLLNPLIHVRETQIIRTTDLKKNQAVHNITYSMHRFALWAVKLYLLYYAFWESIQKHTSIFR